MINRVILVGRITKDPELRFVSVDIPMVRFSLAINRNFVNKDGNREVDFVNCIVWRKQAENLTKYISKGALLGVEGSVRTSSYDNEEGVKKYVTEILCDNIKFLESKKDQNVILNDEKTPSKSSLERNFDDTKFIHEETDDDGLPF